MVGIAGQPNMGGFGTEPLSEVGGIMVHFLHRFAGTIFTTIDISFLLIILLTVLQKKRLAIVALWLVLLAPDLVNAINVSWIPLPGDILMVTILTIAVARFGLLAFYSCFLFAGLSFSNPITSDFSCWYAGSTLFIFVVILSLAIYCYYTSLAGQKIFETKSLKNFES